MGPQSHPYWTGTACSVFTPRAVLTAHQLAIATLATTFSTAAFFLSGGEKADKTQPPINAKSKDEESFVK